MMVESCRQAAAAIGTPTYGDGDKSLRRSLWVCKDMAAGDFFTSGNIRSARPAHGLPVRSLSSFLGQPAAMDIKAGTPLQWGHVFMAKEQRE
jgi:pseudaminic acid synthase